MIKKILSLAFILGFQQIQANSVYIPAGVKIVKGAKIGYSDPCPAVSTPSSHWESALKIWEFAEVCVDKNNSADRTSIQNILNQLASESGHPEIKHVPLIVSGFSWSSGLAYSLVKSFPDRMVAAVIAGITFIPDANTYKVPLTMLCHDGNGYERCVNIVNQARAKDAPWAAVSLYNNFHNWANSSMWLYLYYDYFIRTRLPLNTNALKGPVELLPVVNTNAWYGLRDEKHKTMTPNILPVAKYTGSLNNTNWFPSEGIARAWQAFSNFRDGLYDASLRTLYPYYGTGPFFEKEQNSSVYMTSPYGGSTVPAIYSAKSLGQVFASYTNSNPLKTLYLLDGAIPLGNRSQPLFVSALKHPQAKGFHPYLALAELANGDTLPGTLGLAGINKANDMEVFIQAPLDGDRLIRGTELKILAASGSIPVAKMELWINGEKKQELSKSPYSFSWTASQVGEFVIEVAAKNDTEEASYSWPIKVSVVENSIPSQLILQPHQNWIKPKEIAKFNAIVLDQYGYPMKNPPKVTWSSDGNGEIKDGEFTGNKLGGPFSISASLGNLSAKAKVFVTNRIRVNFQPDWAQSPPGFLVDVGKPYTVYGNGVSYGWNSKILHARQRPTFKGVPDEYTTYLPMHAAIDPPYNKTYSNSKWEIEIPNGTYMVHLVAGDMLNIDDNTWQTLPPVVPSKHIYKMAVEGITMIDAIPTHQNPWVEAYKSITVSDGKLTLTNVDGQNWNKVCFIEIIPPDDAVSISGTEKTLHHSFWNQKPWLIHNKRLSPTTSLPEDAQIKLFSVDGKTHWRGNPTTLGLGIDLSSLNKGTQILSVESGIDKQIQKIHILK